MAKHEQYNLPSPAPNQTPSANPDFHTSSNVVRTDKTLVVKDRYIVNDSEVSIKLGQSVKRVAFSGSNYSVSVNDFLIGITSLAIAPSIGLPSPKKVGDGKTYIVKDEAGGAASTTITVRSESEETIDGASSATITTNYGSKEFYASGEAWFTK